jgi:lipoprotein-releasing system permease protein
MRMPFELSLALRYLRARHKAGISLTSWLTISGVMTGVAALTVVTSVWNGFEQAFLEKLLGVNAHAVVLREFDVFRNYDPVIEKLEASPSIERAAPFVYSEVIAQSPSGVRGVAIKGIDPIRSAETPLARYASESAIRSLVTSTQGTGLPSVLLGRELAEALHLKTGDPMTIISPYGGKGGEARTENFRVVGTFHSGMYEFDARMVFVDLREAQRFFRLFGTITGVEVWSDDPMASAEIVRSAVRTLENQDPLGAYQVRDWSETNRGLFGAVRSQKVLISIVLFIIVIVAAFNIMATLILLILEKRREIALLKALGATERSILTVFVLDGQIIGFVGCALGLGLGLAFCSLLGHYGLRLDPRVYYLEQLPIVVRPLEIGIVIFGAMFLATVATLFPASRAARTHPVDGLTDRSQTPVHRRVNALP